MKKIIFLIFFINLIEAKNISNSFDAQGNSVTQLTFGPGNKIDACWSACGNYIAYTRCEGSREQIAIYNCLTNTETILTPEYQQCGYPSWSETSLQLYS